jgi:hypothetical protein
MSASQIIRFTKAMEDQGVGVTRTKKGLFLRLPNGESDMVHFTNSDTRAFDNLVSRLRRAGVQHPDDPKVLKDLPHYITTGTVKESSKLRVYEYVRENDYPTEVYQGEISKKKFMDPGSVNRVLYHSGFIPSPSVSKKKGRPWLTPAWLLEEKGKDNVEDATPEPKPTPITDAALADFVERGRRAQEAVDELGAGRPPENRPDPLDVSRETSGREFIDTHDSWTLDLSTKPAHLTLSDYLSILESAGLGYEIRVWRTR